MYLTRCCWKGTTSCQPWTNQPWQFHPGAPATRQPPLPRCQAPGPAPVPRTVPGPASQPRSQLLTTKVEVLDGLTPKWLATLPKWGISYQFVGVLMSLSDEFMPWLAKLMAVSWGINSSVWLKVWSLTAKVFHGKELTASLDQHGSTKVVNQYWIIYLCCQWALP